MESGTKSRLQQNAGLDKQQQLCAAPDLTPHRLGLKPTPINPAAMERPNESGMIAPQRVQGEQVVKSGSRRRRQRGRERHASAIDLPRSSRQVHTNVQEAAADQQTEVASQDEDTAKASHAAPSTESPTTGPT